MIISHRLAGLKDNKEEVSKTTDYILDQHTELNDYNQKNLSEYTAQELESIIISSGKEYSLEFLKNFQSLKGGILTQIQNFIINRLKHKNSYDFKKAANTFGIKQKFVTGNRIFNMKTIQRPVFYNMLRTTSIIDKKKARSSVTFHRKAWIVKDTK